MVRTTETPEMEVVETKKRTRSDSGKDSPVEVEVISANKKPNLTQQSDAPVTVTDPVKSQVELYKESLLHEESEVERRPAEMDQQNFLGTCSDVRSLMAEILDLKTKPTEKSEEAVEDRRVKIMMLMLSLRKLSRTQKVRVRIAREDVLEARHGVDGVTLQLQGLLYEVLHLQKEAQRCLLAHTADKEIELLPLEQFYQQAPPTIARPEVTLDDPHQQRLARLHWELEQRRSQTTLSDTLTEDQQQVQQQIQALKHKLAELAPSISSILQSTVPLQNALDLRLTLMTTQQDTAQLLPMPLYTLWMQTSAYSEAGDPLVSSMIRGEPEIAKRYNTAQLQLQKPSAVATPTIVTTTTTFAAAALDTTAGDSDNDVEDNSNDVSSHKSRGSRTASSSSRKDPVLAPGASSTSSTTPSAPAPPAAAAAAPDPIKQMLTLHPLHVEVTVSTAEGCSVVIQFHYATELRFITSRCVVISKARQMVPGAVVLTDTLSGADFLDCLFPEDSGLTSPNPATVHQLRRYYAAHQRTPATVSSGEAAIPPEIGRAYRWAQLLAGLAFPYCKQGEPAVQSALLSDMAQEMEDDAKPDPSQSTSSCAVSSERVHVTLSAIRRRLRSRLALHQQLLALQGANSTSCIPVPSEWLGKLFPGKVCTELTSWRAINWRDYSAQSSTDAIREAGLATDRCLYFRAVYQRRHVDMVAYVCISPDYPQVVPLFALEMKWGEQICPYNHVQQLEAEVNVHWSELTSSGTERGHVLPLMLYRLAMCMDVYTEAASTRLTEADPTASADTHFHKEKIFFRPARGPDRAFPLKYLPKLRVFAQR